MRLWRRRSIVSGILALLLLASTATAQAQQESAVCLPGPGASGDNSYIAFLEQPAGGLATSGGAFVVSGWLVDTTAQGWAGFDQVQVYNGLMGAGGTLLASAD